MGNEEFAEMLKHIIEEEEERLQVGSSSFIRRDKMIEQAREKKV